MPRLQPVNTDNADSTTATLLRTVEKKMGTVPNLIATMANSPAVANAYLGFSQSLTTGSLPPPACGSRLLWLSARQTTVVIVWPLTPHSANKPVYPIRRRAMPVVRLRQMEMEGTALEFARKIVADRGIVSDGDVQQVRQVGYTDGEIAEIVAHVALNIFTNYFNHVAETEVDFPVAPELTAA